MSVIGRECSKLVATIAADHNLDLDALLAKYSLPKSNKVKRSVATVLEDGTALKCSATTAKKLPCLFNAQTGSVHCGRHLKQFAAEAAAKAAEAGGAGPATGPIKVPKVKKVKTARVDSVHTHPVDAVLHADCTHCTTFGNPLAPLGALPFTLERVAAPPAELEMEEGPTDAAIERSASAALAAITADFADSDEDLSDFAAEQDMPYAHKVMPPPFVVAEAPPPPFVMPTFEAAESESESESEGDSDSEPEPKRAKLTVEAFSDDE